MNDMDGINYEKMNIQWFPGHMTKAQRMIEDNVKLVDAVCEILDARIPFSSRNPDIDRLAAGKPRLVILNRSDLADPELTARKRKNATGNSLRRGFFGVERDRMETFHNLKCRVSALPVLD